MSVYLVSFELKYDDTYNTRYSSFMEQVKQGLWWAENTSFVVVKSTENIDDFCSRIYYHSDFNGSKDRFLVLDADVKEGRARGDFADQDLFKILPFVKKL